MARILIVEQIESRRYFMIRTLENAGHAVAAAHGTDAALVVMAHGRYDLLLTNDILAGSEGVELARRVLEQDPAIHVMFTTGDRSTADEVLKELPPTVRVYPTPFELGELVSRVESALAA